MDDPEIKEQLARLEVARRDKALLATVPRVVAAGFGAIPLGERGGTLEVAVAECAGPRAVAALPRVLARPVRPVVFGDAVMHVFLRRIYLEDESLNFHTFVEEDFLERESSLPLLRTEKEYEPVKPVLRPDPERLVLLDYAYRSDLRNLDAKGGPAPFEAGPTDLAFELVGDGAVLHRIEPLPPAVLIVARESYSYAGLEHAHGWRAHEIRKLPFFVHPTELQVTGIEPDGTLHFYVYDRVERVRPGETPLFDVTYHFLSMGQRLRRRLKLKVYGLASVPRARVRATPDPIAWRPEHLERWLGFDLESPS